MASAPSFTELVANNIWISERPVWFSNVLLRSRTTVVRLRDDQLWVHSAGEPTAETCSALDRLGEVRWIVVPNKFHHLQAPAMKARYPKAAVVAPASAKARNDKLVIDLAIDDPRLESQVDEIAGFALKGAPFLDETLFFHKPSGTLIGADVMMCGCAKDHWTWRWVSRITGQYERFKLPPDVRWNTRASDELRASLDRLCNLPMQRILVAHSDAIEDRPAEQLADAWKFARK